MPEPPIPAIIFRRPGHVAWLRQVQVCMHFADQHHYSVASVVQNETDVLALVRTGLAAVVIAAFDLPGDDELAEAVVLAGGRLEYCRPPRYRKPEPAIASRNTDEIVVRMHDLGEKTVEIVRMLGVPAQRVRDVLRRRSS